MTTRTNNSQFVNVVKTVVEFIIDPVVYNYLQKSQYILLSDTPIDYIGTKVK